MSGITRRQFTAGAVSAAVLASLTACSSDEKGGGGSGSTIVVASVNNAPMVTMQKMSSAFTKETGIKVKFVMLTENDIRAKIQQDVAVNGGQFDIVTLGTNDTGTYLDSGWTEPLKPMLDDQSAKEKKAYDFDDIIPAVLPAYSSAKKGLAAIPLYGESTMIMYRKDLFDKAGMSMPEKPSWDQIYDFARKLNDPSQNMTGMAIRGKAGYGENMYIFNTIMYAYGAQIADMKWQPEYTTPEMAAAWEFYRKLQKDAGAAGASSNGYTETLNLMSSGHGAIYYDATVSADTFEAPGSEIRGKLGYAMSPSGPGKGNTQTTGGWGLAIPSSSKNKDAAFKFISWVTSRDYVQQVAKRYGWLSVPTAVRKSTYAEEGYRKLAPYADIALHSVETVSFAHPAVNKTPYTGNSLPNISEWSGLGQDIGQLLAGYISSNQSTQSVLASAQADALKAFQQSGRIKK